MSASYDDLFGSSSDSDSVSAAKKAVIGTNPPRGSFGVRSQGRGRWQSSRGRGNHSQRGGRAQESVIVPNWPKGDLIDSVELADLEPENVAPTISEVQYAASYNLLDGPTQVILVPGIYHILQSEMHKVVVANPINPPARLSGSLVTTTQRPETPRRQRGLLQGHQ